jgi:hypothetical protein
MSIAPNNEFPYYKQSLIKKERRIENGARRLRSQKPRPACQDA